MQTVEAMHQQRKAKGRHIRSVDGEHRPVQSTYRTNNSTIALTVARRPLGRGGGGLSRGISGLTQIYCL